MENKYKHFSIWLIFNLTQIAFWGLMVIVIIVVGISILQSLGLAFENLSLGIQLPNKFDVLEKGTLTLSSTTIDIRVTNASGNIQFENIPRAISIFLTLCITPILFGLLLSVWLFKSFLANVMEGQIFNPENIKTLKKVSYIILASWVYMKVVVMLFNIFITHQFIFKTLQFEYTSGSFGILLWLSLFIWVLSHIFEKGAEIDEENRLTI
jgi:hypothetical protein